MYLWHQVSKNDWNAIETIIINQIYTIDQTITIQYRTKQSISKIKTERVLSTIVMIKLEIVRQCRFKKQRNKSLGNVYQDILTLKDSLNNSNFIIA